MFSYKYSKTNPSRSSKNQARSGKNMKLRRRLQVEGLEERRLMATFQVLNNNDDGAGSLRAAVVSANANVGEDTIEFAIAGADKKISLRSVLPALTDPAVIDATTQPGFVDRPLIQIDGSAISNSTSTGLFITAGDSTVRGLSITNFANGVIVENLGGNKIEGNYLGLSLNGTAAGNRFNGILLKDSPANVVGGSTALQRNVVSSNSEFGIRVQGPKSLSNLIQGNYIGTDITGLTTRPNQGAGVLVDSASGTIVGTDGNGVGDAGEANLISGNGQNGVSLLNAANNVVAGNLIGVALGGTTALPNGFKGVTINGGSNNNRVGTNGDDTSDALERNTISGNGAGGIEMVNADKNVIAGNYIGTSSDGLQLVRNQGIGLLMREQSDYNRIGTNADGVSDFLELNLISGNETNAIQMEGCDFNVLAGNWLGLSSDGETPIENGHSGMWILAGSSDNLIGTNDDGIRDDVERNVISGNRLQGIAIDGTYDAAFKTEQNVVAGNFIGTDKTGTKAVSNETGVYLIRRATSNIIGVRQNSRIGSSAGNVISGNQFNGVLIRYLGTTGNQVAGNIIGLSADGMHPLGNGHAGITIAEGPTGNVIGGESLAQANYVSSNKSHGIWIVDASTSNSVDGNIVGLAIDRATPMGNGSNGVLIQNSHQNHLGIIAPNTIAYNKQAGIAVSVSSSIQNEFSRNLLYGNRYSAIDLGIDGPTSNDLNDADFGPNQLQNYPTLISAATAGSKFQVAGRLASAPNTHYRIEYFAKTGSGDAIDSMIYLGTEMVTSGPDGLVNWVTEMEGSPDLNSSIIATASSAQSGTSEFSAPIPIQSRLPLTIAQTLVGESVGKVKATVSRGSLPTGVPLTISLSSDNPALIQVPDTVEIPADQLSMTFDITVVNDTIWKVNLPAIVTATSGDEAAGSASIIVTDDDSPWHNHAAAVDVSGNSAISPLDVLLVINILNTRVERSIYELSQPSNGSKLFADVNDDKVVSPLDALIVINQLNANANAEGEAVSVDVTTEPQSLAYMIDFALLDLDYITRRK